MSGGGGGQKTSFRLCFKVFMFCARCFLSVCFFLIPDALRLASGYRRPCLILAKLVIALTTIYICWLFLRM